MTDRNERRRVVVTGMGALTPVGNNLQETWEALVAGHSGVTTATLFDSSPFPVHIAAEVKGFDPGDYINPKEARRMARCSQFAIVAGREAVADAGLDWSKEDMERVGVVLGTGIGGVELLVEPIGKFLSEGSIRITPFTAIEALCNMPAFHIGIDHGCLGPLSTLTTACAAGTQSIGDGVEMIRRNASDIVLAGGSEAQVNALFFIGFSAMRVLSDRNDEPARASRPFDADRNGFVIGEGAGVLVLEELEHALNRGARIYAEILGHAASADAYHVAQPDANGTGPGRCMRWALQDAGISPEQVDYINTHGSSTQQNDAAETAAIKRIFGERAYELAINSTKSMIGHLFGAAGAVEGIATVMSVHTDTLHPTINYETPDPACDLDCVPNFARRRPVRVAMSNSFGLGGQNACIVVGKWE
jgi:beta-ketoacyl-acyl-carrier-protein synthase II